MLALQVEWLSERGGRKYNEDACGHWRSSRQLCAVLADGAGGHGGGDVASRLAVREMVGRFAKSPTHCAGDLSDLMHAVNDTLLGEQIPGTSRQNMHSTVVCVVVDRFSGQVHWAHAGDSRLYWFRAGALLLRTRDHSLVQSLADAGMLSAEELRHHPKRSELHSALGVGREELQVAAEDGAEAVVAGDVFLMCTDGMWEYLDDATLETLLAAAPDPKSWLTALCAAVNEAALDKASHDNFTAVAIWVERDPEATEIR